MVNHSRRTIRTAALAFVTALAMAFGLMLGTATTALADDSKLFVQGVEVTAENAADVLGDGTVAYDAATQTLTLENASITLQENSDPSIVMYPTSIWFGVMCSHDLTIELKGENTISSSAPISSYMAAGIEVDGFLKFVGNGELEVNINTTAAEPSGSLSPGYMPSFSIAYGIGTLPMTSTSGGSSLPEYGDILIGEGTQVDIVLSGTGTTPADELVGIMGGKVTVDGGVLSVTNGPAQYQSAGIASYGEVEIIGSSYVSMYLNLVKPYAPPSVHFINGLASIGIAATNAPVHIGGTSHVEIETLGSVDVTTAIMALTTTIDGTSTADLIAGQASLSRGIVADNVQSMPGVTIPVVPPNPIVISDCANVVAMGYTTALSHEPALDGHKVGGAWVNSAYDNNLANATKWDGESALGGEDSQYLFVRIPTSAMITRVAGDEANQTAAAIAAVASNSSNVVVLAREDDFADALGATGLAGTLSCPIVLTNRESLSPAAAEEIKALGATKCYIIGGTGAMKAQLEDDLKAQTNVTEIERLWGEDCYDTSLACAKEIVELGGDAEEAIVAMSMNFQDALSISPIAYKFGAPIVLQTWGDTSADRGFTDDAKAFLADKVLLVVGGTGAISDESLDGLRPAIRLWGESGYDTSNKIAEWGCGIGHLNPSNIVIACGAQAPKGVDALAGAALAGKLSAPILLVNGNEAMEAANTATVDGFLADNAAKVRFCYVLGGTYVVPPELYNAIAEVIGAVDATQ